MTDNPDNPYDDHYTNYFRRKATEGPLSEQAILDVIRTANEHRAKKPNMRTLTEEFAEAVLSARGKHEHPLRLELVQIASIAINILRQIDADEFKETGL